MKSPRADFDMSSCGNVPIPCKTSSKRENWFEKLSETKGYRAREDAIKKEMLAASLPSSCLNLMPKKVEQTQNYANFKSMCDLREDIIRLTLEPKQ